MSKRLGLLGGTFDPIHYGHLRIAEVIGEDLSLDSVLFLPTGTPPHKPDRAITSATHRLQMTELATASNQRFSVSTIDLESPGRSFTVDLLTKLTRLHLDAELVFIMGADSFQEFPTWHDPSGIVRLAKLAVANRPGVELDTELVFAAVRGAKSRTRFVATSNVDVSATDIRARVTQGKSIRYLTPESVRDYLIEHQLYRTASD